MWKVFETQDGSTSVFSEKYNVGYHSKYGAIRESRHVFIEAGLFPKAISKKNLDILEIGFGTGLNALQTYLETERLGLTLQYTTIENTPLPPAVIDDLNFLEKLKCPPEVFQQLHAAAWGATTEISPHFTIEKVEDDFTTVDFTGKFDLLYFDAFSPNVTPELWTGTQLEKCFEALRPGGIFVTYCANGVFKRTLQGAGFQVEALKGPPGKREMTRGTRPFSK